MVMIKTTSIDNKIIVFDTNDVECAISNEGNRYQQAGGTTIYMKGHRQLEFIISMEPDAYAAIACAGFEHVEAAVKIVS